MGNSMGSSGGGKKEIENKLRVAGRTRILNLSDSGLRSTSSVWEKVKTVSSELKTLDISNNKLTDGVPAVIFSLVAVRSLNLSGCSLSSIPDISVLSCVTSFKLDHNRLTSDSIASLPSSLTSLNLSNNLLTELPAAVVGHPALKELIMKDNKIVDLSGIETIMHLASLNCDNNFIVRLPEHMDMMLSIQNISLVNNRLKSKAALNGDQCIPASLFVSTPLQSLNLEGNTELTNKMLLTFDGVDDFLARKKALTDKNLQGGGMVDFSVFGLP